MTSNLANSKTLSPSVSNGSSFLKKHNFGINITVVISEFVVKLYYTARIPSNL